MNIILKVAIFLTTILLVAWLWFISPYKYWWDDDLKQPSNDAIVGIKLVSGIVLLISVSCFLIYRKKDRYSSAFFIIVACYAIFKLIQVFKMG